MQLIEHDAVEYNLAEHCNLNCYGCNHATALLPSKLADPNQLERDLRVLSRVMRVRELRIVGGEPLLHPQLVEILQAVRRIDMAEVIVLYTNGLLLHRAPPRIWQLIDELWVSIYPNVLPTLSVDAMRVLCDSYGVGFRPYEVNELTVTLLNTRIDDPELVARIFNACELAHTWSCHAVHEGRFYKCAQAPFFEPRLARLGIAASNREYDGVPLHDSPDLRDDLLRYLAGRSPLVACDYCLGTVGPVIPHRRTGPAELREWLAEDHRWAIAATRQRLAVDAPDLRGAT